MPATVAHGTVHGKTVLLDDDAPALQEGTKVMIVPSTHPLSGAELVAALRALPPVSREDVEALNAACVTGPVQPGGETP